MANILVVDDSNSMRQMISFALKAEGHTITEAADGDAALREARNHKVELVISDINMPGINGLELTRQLRQQSQYRFTPIILLTTESAADRKAEGKAAGATGWMVKPFDPNTLIATVKKVLN